MHHTKGLSYLSIEEAFIDIYLWFRNNKQQQVSFQFNMNFRFV